MTDHDLLNNNQAIDLTDELLIAAINEQPEHLAIIINRYQAPLSRYIFRLSGLSHEDIEDILQTIFLKMYLNINNFDQTLKFSTWLYRIAHNETISHYRRRCARPTIDYSIDEQALDSLTDSSWQTNADRIIWRTQLNQALDRLPTKYRQIIILRYFEDLDYQTIADIIQQPIGTVATLLSRGKQKLQQLVIK
jgi:RNA polymerase sigma-70 factor (ECF subfamily)